MSIFPQRLWAVVICVKQPAITYSHLRAKPVDLFRAGPHALITEAQEAAINTLRSGRR